MTNTGNTDLRVTSLTDDAGTPGDPGDDLTITCPSILPFDVLAGPPPVTVICTASGTVAAAGAYTNTGAVTAQPLDSAGADFGDPVSASDPANAFGSIPELTTLKSSLTASYAAVGEEIDYTITVTNTGNVTVDAVDVTDPLADPGSIVCVPATPLTLAPGASTTCDATHTVTQADLDAGSVVNIATADGTDPGGNPVTDPSDPVTVPAVQGPALTTVKSSLTASYAAVGEEIDYTITVTNTGNVTVDAVDVTDPLADPGSHRLCSGDAVDVGAGCLDDL